MPIETLGDWNQILAQCCCEMPECPLPESEYEYRDATREKYVYQPYVRPEGDGFLYLQPLYINRDYTTVAWDEGWAAVYQGWDENPTVPDNWAEVLQYQTFATKETAGHWELTITSNSTTGDTGAHDPPLTFSSEYFSGETGYTDFVYIFSSVTFNPIGTGTENVTPASWAVTPTTWTETGEATQYVSGGGEPVLQGENGADGLFIHEWDVLRQSEQQYTLSGMWTLEIALAEIVINYSAWTAIGINSIIPKTAQFRIDEWPRIDDGTFVDPPDEYSWDIPQFDTTAYGKKLRHKWIIPVVGTMNDPDAELPDPLPEGVTEEEWWADNQVDMRWQGTYFKITWDVLTEPDGWDDTIDDPDYEPPVPNDPPEPVPQIPDPNAPEKSYIEDLTWEWTGPGDPNDDESWESPWFEIDPPGDPGIRRIVNVRYECYRSTRFGNKPQITGDAEDLSDDIPLQRRFTSALHSINIALT